MAGVVMAHRLRATIAVCVRWLRAVWSMILRLLSGNAWHPGASSRPGSRARRPNSNGGPPPPKRNCGAPREGRGTNASSSGAVQKPAVQSTKAAHSKSPSISAPALGSPQAAIEEAAAAAAAAQAAVERASRRRLSRLLEQPARERLEHLRDPELTAADRRRLRDSIGSDLPRRSAAKRRRTGVAGVRFVHRRWKAIAAAVVLTALGFGLAVTAWRNTALRTVVSPQTRLVKWALPDGREFVGAWRAGYSAVVTRQQGGQVTLRYWLNGTGYAQATVPVAWLGSQIGAGP